MAEVEERLLSRHGADRKADLLVHARRLFEERGFAETRVGDIAAAAGVSNGLCYWYFASKDHILAELVLDLQTRLGDAISSMAGTADDPLIVIYGGCVASVRFIAANHRLYRIAYTSSSPEVLAAIAAATAHQDADTLAVIERGQQAGTIRAGAAADLARGNAGVVQSMVWTIDRRGRTRAGVEAAAHAAARYVTHALAADDATAADVIERAHRHLPPTTRAPRNRR